VSLLEVLDVHAGYGKMEILKGVSLRVEAGQIVSIIGPNGAGKSTVFKTLFGLLPARQGSVRFDGEDVTNRPPADLLRRGITYVPQGRNVFPLMTVDENLRLGAYIRRRSSELDGEVERVYGTFPMLREARRKRAAELSGGQQQMLEMGRALLLRPRLMLLDEPTLGLAPLLVDRVFEILQELKEEGVTILLVEQNAARTIEVADRTYVMRAGGRIEFHGTADELARIGDFETAYIGLG
jgi:branched-chain amino acid transport system ATP-binding protein